MLAESLFIVHTPIGNRASSLPLTLFPICRAGGSAMMAKQRSWFWFLMYITYYYDLRNCCAFCPRLPLRPF